MIITFCWQGVSDKNVFSHWNDGLREAMRIIEKDHEVRYKEPWEDMGDTDVVVYWEAPCTIQGPHSENYRKILAHQGKKVLLFAGGPLKYEWVKDFDLVFTESAINDKELEEMGVPHKRAFGINERIFEPLNVPKQYDGAHHGTFASWKRQWLLAEALKEKALIFGAKQESDMRPWTESMNHGATVMGKQDYQMTNALINSAHCVVNCADFWGGGQRTTLEAMCAGLPVIAMSDSPKNREYIEECGGGLIVPPEAIKIKEAVEQVKLWSKNDKIRGREYVLSKWTSKHYAKSLLEGITNI